LAMKVANEFLTLILNEDVRARTNRAIETTQFLARETKRLQTDLDAVDAELAEAKRKQADPTTEHPDAIASELQKQMLTLSTMKTDLIGQLSVHSEAHPAVKALKKRIAALEAQIAAAPKMDPANPWAKLDPANSQKGTPENLEALGQRETYLQQALDEATKKLRAARLGESMERDQQAEHLQVIEQPAVPQKPIKPKRVKLFTMAFALAAMAGAGILVLAELMDKSIRGSRDLAAVVDSHLLVAIPYITTPGELARRKRRIILLWVVLAVSLITGAAVAYYIGVEIDSSWFDRSWIDSLTRLTK
jgi:capsule polysaccharide export protein KpsE/RkpR